ncbi:MAG: magnesium chelatase [Chloroflexota bacterium]
MRKAKTIGELRTTNYGVLSVKQEMRKNLIAKMKTSVELFPGILGYEDTVIPQVENAILSGQDIIFLGERGQAKSRLIRDLVNLLDEEIPVIAGCEINDNPYKPICRRCRDKVADEGDRVEISWLPKRRRYGEKLATPDITIADLLGEVDPIKIAEGRYLSDELTIHYGLIPRTNRGIFCINELPDLAERIQVGLFNLMEERDIQIRGYRITLPLDVYVVASANPEDYTNRGRIITPLKDRYGSQIRTHYPRTIGCEIEIMEEEQTVFADDEYSVAVPQYMKEIIAELTSLARRSPDINQRSGVSVRVSISNYENLISNAMRRGIRHSEKRPTPRISDLLYVVVSTVGKIEMETVEEGREERLVEQLIVKAVTNVFNRYFQTGDFEELIASFDAGASVEVSELTPSSDYVRYMNEINGFMGGIRKLNGTEEPASIASAVEFILEGLHLNRRLNKEKLAGGARYRG